MKYKATFSFIDDMGIVPSVIVSDKFTETAKEEALAHVNQMREHDGLPTITFNKLKKYLTLTKIPK
jgi:hypothetical protein